MTSDTASWWEHFRLPTTGGPNRSTDSEIPTKISPRFGAHQDSIYGSVTTSRVGRLTPSVLASAGAAHAAALTHRHPLPPIMEGTFPEYNDALANLPEEPTPITLPAFGPYANLDEDIETEETEADATAYTNLKQRCPATSPPTHRRQSQPSQSHPQVRRSKRRP